MDPTRCSLTLPNRLDCLAPTLAFVCELAQAAGFESQEAASIRLALEEAVTNTLEHGFGPGEQATFELLCEWNGTDLALTIREKGLPFDPARVPAYVPGGSLDDSSTAGLGMFLLRQAMDEVEFRNLGRGGKELRLTKRPRGKRIDARVGREDLARYQQPTVRPAPRPRVPIHIRSLKPGEALEVSRCAYQAYGYSYEDYIYYPDRIAALNAEGLMESLVAVTERDEIAGHIALKRSAPGDAIAEIGVAFVKPEFRSQGVFLDLTNAVLARARAAGLAGLFGRAVTSHTISQKTCRQFGFHECGLLLALFPGDVDFKQLTGRIVQKESSLLLFLPLRPLEGRVIFPPPNHRERIAATYAELGVPLHMGDSPSAASPARETELTASAVAVMNIADIRVTRQGADTVQAVRHSLRQHCLERRDAIYLHLDLESPGTAALAPAFEAMGFFYAGVLPRSLQGRDALMLQYLNNTAIAYDLLKPYSPEAAALQTYVRQHDPGAPA